VCHIGREGKVLRKSNSLWVFKSKGLTKVMKRFLLSIHFLSFLLLGNGFHVAKRNERGVATLLSAQSTSSSRRQWFLQTASAILTVTGAAPSLAAVLNDSQRTIYITGKPPILPGESSQSKSNNSNTQGTRKDPNFLRSISDCKSQCELQGTKSKEECLSECQDICCKTYEQCTFAIVPRI
jgi:hypothetical protein